MLPSSSDYEFTTQIFDERVHVRRFGTDGDASRASELIKKFDGQVDAMGLGSMNIYFRLGQRTYIHKQILQIANSAKATPVVDGIHLKNTFERWIISQIAEQQRGIFSHKKVLFVSGIDRIGIAQVLSRFTREIVFGDPIFQLNFPYALSSFKQLERYAKLILPYICRRPYGQIFPLNQTKTRHATRREKYFEQANIIVGESCQILRFAPQNLKNKLVIAEDVLSSHLVDFKKRGVESLISLVPPLKDMSLFVGIDVLEAIFTSFIGRPTAEISDTDFLNLINRCDLKPQINVLNKPSDVTRFAHVIHPLNIDHILKQPHLKYLRFLPHRLVERRIAKVHPRYMSKITGIRSPVSGKEIEGYLISLGATPRELRRRKPGFTYRLLILASRMAQQRGAKIMGLGAFTKIVGDAGVTVAYKSEIPVTSGNSLTVSATLEAAKQAVVKMGGRTDKGRAMIIGATGAIGAVCSRLIAQVSQDVILVAPRPEKLIPLCKTIESETPGARVIASIDSGLYLSDMDLVVTTTSAFNQKVIDVMKLKPGCVICDVATPPDVTEEDARLRPDVLVIEAGEIQLPGNPDVGFDIGLPKGVVHACMAEPALLAMEGRFESFTLGHNIEIERVKEIYRMFKKHGVKLAGLRSFGQYVTDEDIAIKRKLADNLRHHQEKSEN